LRLLVEFLQEHEEIPMATLALPGTAEDLDNPNVVKVVSDLAGRALYFSRAAIPFQRHASPRLIRRHVGLYGFRRETLLHFALLPECELERAEALEQLRALANGITIQVLEVEHDSVAVDLPGDIPQAESALKALKGRT
jgi:3-deoxy-manno-octulosonate cytidylyltransferase (CMP-KDO synthetase)